MRLVLFCLLFLFVLSCGKEKEEPTPVYTCPVKCFKAPIVIVFDGYSPQDLDTVIMWQAAYSDTFGQVFTFADTVHYVENGKYIGYGFDGMYLNTNRVFELAIPSTGQVYKLSGLVRPDITRQSPCGPQYTCTEAISEVSVSGSDYSLVRYSEYPYYLRLRKQP